jgi:beta-glucanase (GH16 family)
VHWGTVANHQIAQRSFAGDFSQWHTLGVRWLPGRLVYTIDGQEWASVVSPNLPTKPMNLAIQTEANNDCTLTWATCVDGTTPANVNLEVDWVAVYAPA